MTYQVVGQVVEGQRRGKRLGFPTVNIRLTQDVPDGVYAGRVVIDDQPYMTAAFVGASETYGETDKKLEAYILDFDRDLYGATVTVVLHQLIRDPSTFVFESEAQLVRQIEKDIAQVRSYFASKE